VQGDRLVSKPAAKMMTKVAGETPAHNAGIRHSEDHIERLAERK
jgi:hypothetical protein